MKRWKGEENEDDLLDKLHRKYATVIAAFQEDGNEHNDTQEYEQEYVHRETTQDNSDEEDDAPTYEQRCHIEYEERHGTKEWIRFIKLTRELMRMAFLPKCRKHCNLYGPNEGYTRSFDARNQHIIENGWHHSLATHRAAEIAMNVNQ